jgi:hypothetical protein
MAQVSLLLGISLLGACAPENIPPQQVATRNPSVTYRYRGDQELIAANQNASAYCAQYHSAPRAAGIADLPDGARNVTFECVAMSSYVAVQQPNPNLTYTYRTDQELLDSSRNAEVYCYNSGAPRTTSTVTINPDGTRTVTYQCNPR